MYIFIYLYIYVYIYIFIYIYMDIRCHNPPLRRWPSYPPDGGGTNQSWMWWLIADQSNNWLRWYNGLTRDTIIVWWYWIDHHWHVTSLIADSFFLHRSSPSLPCFWMALGTLPSLQLVSKLRTQSGFPRRDSHAKSWQPSVPWFEGRHSAAHLCSSICTAQ